MVEYLGSQLLRSRHLLGFATVLVVAAVAAALAYSMVGWLGVGVTGLWIAFIAVRVDLEQEGPVGGEQNTELFPLSLRGRDAMSQSEKAARWADIRSTTDIFHLAKFVGVALVLMGFGAFLSGQMLP